MSKEEGLRDTAEGFRTLDFPKADYQLQWEVPVFLDAIR